MSDTNDARIRQIYDLALEKPAGQREDFVRRVCGDDALAGRVLALLSAQDEMGDFLAEPTGAASVPEPQPDQPAGEQPGMVVGNYKLLKEIGEGGMGVVWVAEQFQPVRRKVALKVIKLGMDTKQVVARFEAERQALALMDHPNIAKVLDGGVTDEGRPFFVMEFVKGVPITAFCDEQRLRLHERLELFGSVCQAVQHAHHKGIIHRDIKPANVLVTLHDGRPVPKVIDFGIAKATNQELTQKTLFTEYAQILGTPEYMAPEQASMSGLDIDTRADVYSLGVLMYELLTGSKPFDLKTLLTRGYEELLRTIREEDPPKPSTRASSTDDDTARRVSIARQMRPGHLGRELRGDLDWIVVKAMEKDRTRRYETVNGLAADILRFLSDEPVTATPPSAAYRARKFVRRNTGLVAASIVVVAILVVGVAGTSWGLVRAVEQKERAGKAERDSARELIRANEVKRLLTEMLETVDPKTARGEDVTLLKRILDDTGERLLAGEIENESIAAELHEVIGKTYDGLGLWDEAFSHTQKALAIRKRELGPVARPVLKLRRRLGNLLQSRSHPDKARAMLRAVYEDSRRVLGEDDVETAWCQLALAIQAGKDGRIPDAVRDSKAALATVLRIDADRETRIQFLTSHAWALTVADQLDQAESLYQRALKLADRDQDEDVRFEILESYANLLVGMMRLDEAESRYREATRQRRRIYGEDHPTTLVSIGNLARCLCVARQYAEANRILVDARRRALQRLGPNNYSTLYLGVKLLHVQVDSGRFDEADSVATDIVERCERRLGSDHRWTIEARSHLARMKLVRDDDYAGALPLYRAVVEAKRRLWGAAYSDTLYAQLRLARCLRETGQKEEGMRMAREVLALVSQSDDLALHRISMRSSVGSELVSGGHSEEGLAHMRKAVADARACNKPTILAEVLGRLGGTLVSERKNREAVPVLQEAVRLIESGEVSALEVTVWGNLGSALGNVNRFDEAVPVYRAGLVHADRLLGQRHATTLFLRLWLANSLMALKRSPEALPILEKLVPLQLEVLGQEHKQTFNGQRQLSNALVTAGRYAEATEVMQNYLAVRRRVEGERHPRVLAGSAALSGLSLQAREYDEAIKHGRFVVDRAEPGHPVWMQAAGVLAASLRVRNKNAEAVAVEARIEKALRGSEQAKELQRAKGAALAGELLQGEQRYPAARERHLVSLKHTINAVGEDHPALIAPLGRLQRVAFLQEDYAEVEECARRRLAIQRRVLPPHHKQLLGTLTGLGRALLRQKKYEEARVVLEESYAGKRRTLPKGELWTATARNNLIKTYLGLGRRTDAIPLIREQLELDLAPAVDPKANPRALNKAAWKLLTHEAPEVRDPARAMNSRAPTNFGFLLKQAICPGWRPAFQGSFARSPETRAGAVYAVSTNGWHSMHPPRRMASQGRGVGGFESYRIEGKPFVQLQKHTSRQYLEELVGAVVSWPGRAGGGDDRNAIRGNGDGDGAIGIPVNCRVDAASSEQSREQRLLRRAVLPSEDQPKPSSHVLASQVLGATRFERQTLQPLPFLTRCAWCFQSRRDNPKGREHDHGDPHGPPVVGDYRDWNQDPKQDERH